MESITFVLWKRFLVNNFGLMIKLFRNSKRRILRGTRRETLLSLNDKVKCYLVKLFTLFTECLSTSKVTVTLILVRLRPGPTTYMS